MTGEMGFIDQEGLDSNGEEWPLHAAIAKELNGTIKPFDQYQGPYVVFGSDIRVGNNPYAMAPTGLGIKRLWLIADDEDEEFHFWYREDTEAYSFRFWWNDESMALEAAKQLLCALKK